MFCKALKCLASSAALPHDRRGGREDTHIEGKGGQALPLAKGQSCNKNDSKGIPVTALGGAGGGGGRVAKQHNDISKG